MMEQEFVRRRKWLSHQQLLDLLGAVNLIPGPNSTELVILSATWRAGSPGLLLGGICFILPAMLMVAGLAWAYTVYGNLPEIAGLLRGIKPVVIAIIVQALAGLGPKAVKTPWLGLMAVAALAASLMGLDPLSVVLVCGAIQLGALPLLHATATMGRWCPGRGAGSEDRHKLACGPSPCCCWSCAASWR